MQTIEINVGGYPVTFTAKTAGKWGCDRGLCGHIPQAGDRIWSSSYGLYCDPCARKYGR